MHRSMYLFVRFDYGLPVLSKSLNNPYQLLLFCSQMPRPDSFLNTVKTPLLFPFEETAFLGADSHFILLKRRGSRAVANKASPHLLNKQVMLSELLGPTADGRAGNVEREGHGRQNESTEP